MNQWLSLHVVAVDAFFFAGKLVFRPNQMETTASQWYFETSIRLYFIPFAQVICVCCITDGIHLKLLKFSIGWFSGKFENFLKDDHIHVRSMQTGIKLTFDDSMQLCTMEASLVKHTREHYESRRKLRNAFEN